MVGLTIHGCRTALVFLIVAACLFGTGASFAAEVPAKLVPLLQNKQTLALQLAGPAARCVQRMDTSHSAFHGCIDWHSAVHATWSLVAYTAMTNDRRYEPLVKAVLTPKKLKEERRLLANDAAFEMPYGRAWFLRTALEYERYYRDGMLLPLADFVAGTLDNYYRHNPPVPASAAYDNSAWALINMLDYYDFRGFEDRSELLKKQVRNRFLAKDAKCEPEAERPGFMAICTNWAWLASKLLRRDEFARWVSGFLPPPRIPAPVRDPHAAHEYGLNFSRAWGLWELFSVTADLAYINAYVDHVQTTLGNRENWDGDYRTVGHWVPQFGMFAIQPLFGSKFR